MLIINLIPLFCNLFPKNWVTNSIVILSGLLIDPNRLLKIFLILAGGVFTIKPN